MDPAHHFNKFDCFVRRYKSRVIRPKTSKPNLNPMYAVDPSGKKIDTQLLMFTHLSQLLTCVTGVGGLIVPLIIWLTQKDKIADMDLHGKSIINFQLSLIVWAVLSIPLIILLGLGVAMLILIGIVSVIFPVLNAIKASNGEDPFYRWSFTFIK